MKIGSTRSTKSSPKTGNNPNYRTRLSLQGLEDRVTPTAMIDPNSSIDTPAITSSHETASTLKPQNFTLEESSQDSNNTVLFGGPSNPRWVITIGASPGKAPTVRVHDVFTNELKRTIQAYDSAFTGGVNATYGDINKDGVADIITGVRSNGAPHIKVFDGATGAVIRSFYAFSVNFTGGVSIASADVNNDGADDIIVGAASRGAPHVKVFSGANGEVLKSFYAYSANMTAGVRVAGGDVNADGKDDIITAPGVGVSSHVKVFDGNSGAVLNEFFAYAPGYTGGVSLGTYDFEGDGSVDIYTGADSGADPHIKRFSALTGRTLESYYVDPVLITLGKTPDTSAESLASQLLNNFSNVSLLMARIAW